MRGHETAGGCDGNGRVVMVMRGYWFVRGRLRYLFGRRLTDPSHCTATLDQRGLSTTPIEIGPVRALARAGGGMGERKGAGGCRRQLRREGRAPLRLRTRGAPTLRGNTRGQASEVSVESQGSPRRRSRVLQLAERVDCPEHGLCRTRTMQNTECAEHGLC